ncbi:MAG: hypothetical protein AB7Q97_01370 [Gammaproteobacteria bacterium]
MAKERGFGRFMAWIGVGAALISFGAAVYELLHAQGELRERRRIVAEQIAGGETELAAGAFPAAWESLQRAGTTAEIDGLFAKLLGGLSGERQTVRAAQEDLAMNWLRSSRATEGQTLGDLADKLTNTLATGANAARDQRQADLLAHLGWAYFLKHRSGDLNVMPDEPYRRAVAVDANNPYAHVFWGHWILWNRGSLEEAREHFAAALKTGRARTEVRYFQLAALANVHSDAAEAEWLRVVEDMRENGEPLNASIKNDLYDRYYFALNARENRDALLAAIGAEKQLELQRMLLDWNDLEPHKKHVVKALGALTLEAASRRDEALAAWRGLLAETGSEPNSTVAERARHEIERLSRGAPR